MEMSKKRAGRRAGGTLLGLAAMAAVIAPASHAGASTAFGRFTTLPAGTDMGMEIEGIALVNRTAGGTSGRVVVLGLEPGRTYAAHLHAAACDNPGNPGGGHYQDHTPPPTAPPNELWFSSTSDPTAGITANRAGVAVGRGSAEWVARAQARSVVIHFIPTGGTTAGGPKIACADLS